MIIASPGCEPVRRISLSGTVGLPFPPYPARYCTCDRAGAAGFAAEWYVSSSISGSARKIRSSSGLPLSRCMIRRASAANDGSSNSRAPASIISTTSSGSSSCLK